MRATPITSAAATVALALALVVAQAGLAQEFESLPWTANPDPAEGQLPNAERPLSHEELLAIRGEIAERDWAMTLVAEARIERLPTPRPPAPGRKSIEVFGTLPREDFPGDPVVEAQAHVRDRYAAEGETIVDGLLAIHLAGTSVFRGEVSTPAGSYLTPISAPAMELADELPEHALILVRGSLTRLSPDERCPAPPRALRGRGFGGSPFIECPAGWLTAEPITVVSTTDPLAPEGFGIRVQGGARDAFWSRYDEPYVEPSTYLLQHVSSPLPEHASELRWKVIGVVGPIQAPPAPSTRTGATVPDGLDWQPALERLPPSDTSGGWSNPGVQVTSWDDGFAAVHQGRDRVLTSWVSADGRDWRSSSLPRGIREVEALLRLDDGLVIIADEVNPNDGTGTWRFEVWHSDDGLEWRQVSTQSVKTPDRFSGRSNRYYRIVQGYWSVGGRIVAHETYTTYRCCGRSTGTSFVAADKTKPVTFAWTSESGSAWRRTRVSGLELANGWHYRSGMHEIDGTLYAISDWPDFVIDRSFDGVSWKRVGTQPKGLDSYSDITLDRSDRGFVLGGTVGSTGVVWFSTDLQSWEVAYRPAAGFPFDLATAGGTVVAVGGPTWGTGDAGDQAPRWMAGSTDGGRSFDPDLGWETEVDWCDPDLEASGQDIVLSISCPPFGMASKYVAAPSSTR